jgi:hypothetical protein
MDLHGLLITASREQGGLFISIVESAGVDAGANTDTSFDTVLGQASGTHQGCHSLLYVSISCNDVSLRTWSTDSRYFTHVDSHYQPSNSCVHSPGNHGR